MSLSIPAEQQALKELDLLQREEKGTAAQQEPALGHFTIETMSKSGMVRARYGLRCSGWEVWGVRVHVFFAAKTQTPQCTPKNCGHWGPHPAAAA
jgi:hypothetical protein